jgi:hypothetical protein
MDSGPAISRGGGKKGSVSDVDYKRNGQSRTITIQNRLLPVLKSPARNFRVLRASVRSFDDGH